MDMKLPKVKNSVHYGQPVEGVLVRDIMIGALQNDFFYKETSMSENGVGRDVSQGILAYQTGTPVMLCNELHFDGDHKLGYFMVGGRPPLLMADLSAFRKVSWNDLLAEQMGEQGRALGEKLDRQQAARDQAPKPEPKNLAEALASQIERVTIIRGQYLDPILKGAGAPAAALMDAELKAAEAARTSGDVVEMLRAFRSLESFSL